MKFHTGEVLYLSLEDTQRRLQQRLNEIAENVGAVHFATRSEFIGGGFEEQFVNFIERYPKVKLIIIDTLQKVQKTGKDKFAYADDYDVLGKIRKLETPMMSQYLSSTIIGSRNLEPANQDSSVGRTLTSKYYPEWSRQVTLEKKWHTFINHTPGMIYNGIAYEMKWLAQRDLLEGKSLAKSMHQDVDTS